MADPVSSSSTPLSISFGAAWRLAKPYWVSKGCWKGWLLLATIIGLSLAQVYLSVQFNTWNGKFYNALQDKNLPEFKHQLGLFCGLATTFIIVAVYHQYFNQMLTIRWRQWMTQKYQTAWLSEHAYYRLQVLSKSTDNPDQRIADDIDGFTSSTLSLSIGLMSSVVSLFSFLGILWGLSGMLEFTALGHDFAIPGYMLWVAVLYALIGTCITHLIGRPLTRLNFDQQRFEANFRYAMVRLRENAENIAFYKGESAERGLLSDRFSNILQNWWRIMKKQKQLNWFTSGYGQIAVIFPIVVAAPRYFSGVIQLGGLTQTASAFGHVQAALSWLIDVYPQFANWKATANRLDGFLSAISSPDHEGAQQDITLRTQTQPTLSVEHLSITLPDGTKLIDDFSLSLQPGDRLLLTGPSGSGKTTLLRAVAGLWPYGHGTITLPGQARIAFVPQRPYLPLLTLKAAICYPQEESRYEDAQVSTALTVVGLEQLIPQLAMNALWAQSLSLGEQQKLAFARLWLQQPEVVLLDEATASLDESAESRLYALLMERLPQAILISVGHRSTLRAFHTQEKAL